VEKHLLKGDKMNQLKGGKLYCGSQYQFVVSQAIIFGPIAKAINHCGIS
jgi:hypothetical protein